MRRITKNRLIALLTLVGFLAGALGPIVPHAMASEHCAMMVASPAADDGHAGPIARIARDRLIDLAISFLKLTVHERDVRFENFPCAKLIG